MALSKRLDEVKLITTLLCDIQQSFKDVFNTRQLRQTNNFVERRCRKEGLGFLTKSLPQLGKALDKALLGLAPLNITETRFKTSPGGELPRFLGEFFSRVFHQDGTLLPEPCTTSVLVIRQVLYLFYKYELPYTDEQTNKVINGFIEAEADLVSQSQEMLQWSIHLGSHRSPYRKVYALGREDDRVRTITKQEIVRAARAVLNRLFSGFDPLDINPAHGPGAVATKQLPWDKYVWTNVSDRLTDVYPLDSYFFASLTAVCDVYPSWNRIGNADLPARVVLVPKDSRGPRLISCEPVDFQWIQQGLMRAMVSHVERHPLTRDNVRFTDQVPNQNAALIGSATGRYATLDLKEASDRVSLDLVSLLFPEHLFRCLSAARSSSTQLPCGKIVKLQKYAPMGSALCFPVMALTIWALLHVTMRSTDAQQSIYVYGDDVIVPTAQAANAITVLESFGLKVNRDKSCTSGFFRESCGLDAFRGKVVTPLRLRTVWTSHQCPNAYASWISYANSFCERGYVQTARYITEHLRSVYGPIPSADMPVEAPALHETLHSGWTEHRKRWNKDLQKVQYLVRDIKSKEHTIEIPGWQMLLRFFSESPLLRGRPECFGRKWDFVLAQNSPGERGFQVRSYTRRRASMLVRRWR